VLTREVANFWEEDMQLPFASIHCQYRMCSIDTASVKEQKTLKLHKNAAQTRGTMQTSWQLGLMFTSLSYMCVCVHRNTHNINKGTHNWDAINHSPELEETWRWTSYLLSTVMAASQQPFSCHSLQDKSPAETAMIQNVGVGWFVCLLVCLLVFEGRGRGQVGSKETRKNLLSWVKGRRKNQ